MLRITLVSLWLLATAAILPAAASVFPSPLYSTVQPCLVADFAGTSGFQVIVRDNYGRVMPLAFVVIDITGCPTARFCPSPCTGCLDSPAPGYAVLRTDINGAVTFDLRVSGVCASEQVTIYADGVLLARRAVATPDHDGDGLVTASDVAAIHARIGTADPTADFDCSGTVDAADEAFAATFVRTACESPVPTRPRSWGRLKVRYR